MKLYAYEQSPFHPQGNGGAIKVQHTDRMTLTTWRLDAGFILPMHAHPQEQITYVIEGRMEFQTDKGTLPVNAGEMVVFAGNEAHGGKALENCLVIDIFSAIREDFRSKFTAIEPVVEV